MKLQRRSLFRSTARFNFWLPRLLIYAMYVNWIKARVVSSYMANLFENIAISEKLPLNIGTHSLNSQQYLCHTNGHCSIQMKEKIRKSS